jgi:hypothetical protein
MNSKLQLGPLPDLSTVRLTIRVPATLKEAIDRYAELHAKTWGTRVDAETLIPHIVETFLAKDRQFRKVVRSVAKGGG